MPAAGGRDQRGPMERLVRIAAVLKVAGADGVSGDRLVRVAGFVGEHAVDQLERDLKYLRQQGWEIRTVSPPGQAARYRMITVDNRFRVRLTPAQQRALQRAVILANRKDLVDRLGLPAAEQPSEPAPALPSSGHDDRLSAVLGAVRHRRLVRFRYGGKDRVVHPHSVRLQNERWYFRGLEGGGDVVKAFVVTRMSGIQRDAPGTADRVESQPSGTLHPMRWRLDPPVEATVRTTPAYRPDVERWLGEARATDVVGDDIELRYEVTNRSGFRARLYELGERVRLVGPEELRRELLDHLAEVAGGRPG